MDNVERNKYKFSNAPAVVDISEEAQVKREEQISFILKELFLYNVLLKDLISHKPSEKDKNLKSMGTTVIVCVVSMNKLYGAHMGDSRAYLISDDEITQITTDHSMVQEMLDNGKLTIEEARNHPQKNIITRALGVNPEIKL